MWGISALPILSLGIKSLRKSSARRAVTAFLVSLAAAAIAPGTTLQQLSVVEMTQQATTIVRAKVTGSAAVLRGNQVWTLYQLETLETLKGGAMTEVAVPGGAAGGLRQVVAGAPSLSAGGEYVLFLWTGRSGVTQVIGLSQGLLAVARDAHGNVNLVRPASKETMLDANLKPVSDQDLRIGWNDFRSRILSQSKAKPEPGKAAR
jgi:hypothetical protein